MTLRSPGQLVIFDKLVVARAFMKVGFHFFGQLTLIAFQGEDVISFEKNKFAPDTHTDNIYNASVRRPL